MSNIRKQFKKILTRYDENLANKRLLSNIYSREVVFAPLTKEEISKIKAYWKPYLFGQKLSLPYWSYHKGAGVTNELEKCIPDNIWFNVICVQLNDTQFARHVGDKSFYDMIPLDIPMPNNLLIVMRGELLDRDYNLLTLKKAAEKLKSYDEVVCKPAKESSCGNNVFVYKGTEAEVFLPRLLSSGNWVVQEMIKQSPSLSCFHPGSVNTIRVTTFNFKGEVHIMGAILRLGVGKTRVDNVSSGGIFVALDLQTGKLFDVGYTYRYLTTHPFKAHPETGIVFKNHEIPHIMEIFELAKKSAKKFPWTKIVGWDFTLDQNDKPLLIEFNLENQGIDVYQIAYKRPYFGKMSDEVLEYVKKRLD